jgi:hypothetical protein
VAYADEVLADAPLAYWRLDDPAGSSTMLDASGSGRNGVYDGSPTRGVSGLLGSGSGTAVDFPGSTVHRGRVADAAWMDVSQFTIEAVVKPSASNQSRVIAARYNGSFSQSSFLLRQEGTQFVLYLGVDGGGNRYVYASGVTITAGTTYHVAASWDGTTARIYVNGVLRGSSGTSAALNASALDLTIGANSDGSGSDPYAGVIDEVAYYGTVLPLGRITAHYAAGFLTPYPASVLAESPLAYYRLGETSGLYMLDSSGNGRTGDYDAGGVILGAAGLLPGDPDKAIDIKTVSVTGRPGRVDYAAWMDLPAFSVETLFQPDSVDAGPKTLVSRFNGTGANDMTYSLRLDGDVVTFWRGTAAGFVSVASSVPVVVGGTYHVVATYDGTTARLYLNGALVGSAAQAAHNVTNQRINIGSAGSAGGGGERFDGRIDEVAFYGAALSPARVAAHYAAAGIATPAPQVTASLASTGKFTARAVRGDMGPNIYPDPQFAGPGGDTGFWYGASKTTALPPGLPPSYTSAGYIDSAITSGGYGFRTANMPVQAGKQMTVGAWVCVVSDPGWDGHADVQLSMWSDHEDWADAVYVGSTSTIQEADGWTWVQWLYVPSAGHLWPSLEVIAYGDTAGPAGGKVRAYATGVEIRQQVDAVRTASLGGTGTFTATATQVVPGPTGTRFYLPSAGAPAVSPAFHPAWTQYSDATRRPLVRTKSNTPISAPTPTKGEGNERALSQFVSEPLAAQTISGTVRVAISAMVTWATFRPYLQMRVSVCGLDGSSKAVLWAGLADQDASSSPTAPNYLFDQLAEKIRVQTDTLTSYTCSAGDRLVIELGYWHILTELSGRYAWLRFGDPTASSDIPATVDARDTANAPWVQFSQDFTFIPEPPPGPPQVAAALVGLGYHTATVAVVPPVTNVVDSFNRPDGPVGTADSGHVWQGHAATISSNRLYVGTSQNMQRAYLDAGRSNLTMTVDVHRGTENYQTLWLRYDHAANTAYRVAFGNDYAFVEAWNGGTREVLTEAFPLADNSMITASVKIEEVAAYGGAIVTRITVYRNGVPLFEVDDNTSSRPKTATGIALSGQGTDYRFDNLRVTAPVDPVVPIARTASLTGTGNFTATRALVTSAPQVAGALVGTGTFTATVDGGDGPVLAPAYLLVSDAEVDQPPGTITVAVANFEPLTVVTFTIDGVTVTGEQTDASGAIVEMTIPVARQFAAGPHAVAATTATRTASGAFTVLTDAAPLPQPQAPSAPPQAVPNAVNRWVFQDTMPGGLGTWVMPINPTSMGNPHVRKTVAVVSTTTVRGRPHVSEGATPVEWEFAGFAPDKAFQDKLIAYSRLAYRFYVIDHRGRAWTVAIARLAITPRKRSRDTTGAESDWMADYTVALALFSQTPQELA